MISKIEGTMGILVAASNNNPLLFSESGFVRKLCLTAAGRGLTIFAFTPQAVTEANRIHGYTYQDGMWVIKAFPFPDIVYDRCFAKGEQKIEKRRKLALLARKRPFRYLTRGLAGKWSVYETLKLFDETAPYLPETCLYTKAEQLAAKLFRWKGEAFLKPQFGTHGKMTLHVRDGRSGEGRIQLTGRDSRNTVFNRQFASIREAARFIEMFRRGRSFLLQPYLQLSTKEGEPFDIRVLMQKGADGRWSMTGMAARVGKSDSLTSNLHGGGRAFRASQLLKREFGAQSAKSVLTAIRRLAAVIPPYLEEHFGRLAELGIDFGVDSEENVWILEVNSKPGRSAFGFIGDMNSARKAVENPILYACHLLKQS
ncbi:YheC/YheD family protein [Paenibacillus caui]|uniref:YheC/YheD family endospore coat-associated protein n=1 Tax=Paenibacillus caui TaxID=2873927 RepID=UPI001CA7BF43|nr:YheC/YheD family protein [Paenibacillus caui]